MIRMIKEANRIKKTNNKIKTIKANPSGSLKSVTTIFD